MQLKLAAKSLSLVHKQSSEFSRVGLAGKYQALPDQGLQSNNSTRKIPSALSVSLTLSVDVLIVRRTNCVIR